MHSHIPNKQCRAAAVCVAQSEVVNWAGLGMSDGWISGYTVHTALRS